MQQQCSVGIGPISKINLVISFKLIFFASFNYKTLKLLLWYRVFEILSFNLFLRFLFLLPVVRLLVYTQIMFFDSLFESSDSFAYLLKFLNGFGKRFSADEVLLNNNFYFQHGLTYKRYCKILPIETLIDEVKNRIRLADNFLFFFVGQIVRLLDRPIERG